MWTSKSNLAIMLEMGIRLKEYRIRQNMKQTELAEHAGVSIDTVKRLENGCPVTTEKLIRIMRVLDMLENFEEFIPEPPISPILLQELNGKQKYRVRK